MGWTDSSHAKEPQVIWPDNKRFAFTIFDDTDLATLENVGPVYDLLADLGICTTKSVWPLAGTRRYTHEGATCEAADYVDWLKQLRQRGFEIGYHGATWHTSPREVTERALTRFEQLFGAPPKSMSNHASCKENIHWGPARLSGVRKLIYDLLTFGRYRNYYRGHIDGDSLFWGDLCRDKIQYVRGFVFPDINTLKACPNMPYHDALRPYVQFWFASSEGPTVQSFNHLISDANQDRLEAEGGACIVYTHLAAGFCTGGEVNRQFSQLMHQLARRSGWFVPVARLLDFLRTSRGEYQITDRERARLEWQWLRFKLRRGRS